MTPTRLLPPRPDTASGRLSDTGRRLAVAALVALSLGLSACGGGGGPAGTPILNSGRIDSNPGLPPGGGGTTPPAAQAVTYAVTGSATAAEITYTAADRSNLSVTATLPWSVTIQAETGSPLAVSARSTSSLGSLTASIRQGSTTLREATSSTPFAQVSATATCCEPSP